MGCDDRVYYDQDGIEGEQIALPPGADTFSWRTMPPSFINWEWPDDYLLETPPMKSIYVAPGKIVIKCQRDNNYWFETMTPAVATARFCYKIDENGEFICSL